MMTQRYCFYIAQCHATRSVTQRAVSRNAVYKQGTAVRGVPDLHLIARPIAAGVPRLNGQVPHKQRVVGDHHEHHYAEKNQVFGHAKPLFWACSSQTASGGPQTAHEAQGKCHEIQHTSLQPNTLTCSAFQPAPHAALL